MELSKPKVIKMAVAEVSINEITTFDSIPDYSSEYQRPYPTVIKREHDFVLIGGRVHFQEVPAPLENEKILIITDFGEAL